MENVGLITIDDINSFASEEKLTPVEHATLINDYTESKSDRNKLAYIDDPEKLILEQQKLQASSLEAMKTPREREAYDRVYKASGEDLEQTNLNLGYIRMKSAGKPFIAESGFGTSYEYEPAGEKELNSLFNEPKDNPFHLTEKASLRTEYVSDNKGNPVASVHVAQDGDNRVASFKLIEDGKETPPYSMQYTLPSPEDVDTELKRMYSEIESMTPSAANDVGGLGDGVRARMKAGESKKWQEYRDKEKEYRFLQDLNSKNPEAAREYLATKNRDDTFSQSDYARENITEINPLKDLEKGVARLHYTVRNAIYDGKDEETNNNLDALNRDSSVGSQTYGLKKTGAMDDFLNRVPSSMESLGNMVPSLAISSLPIPGAASAGLALMGVGAYGSQLDHTDTLIDQVKGKLDYEQRTNPNSPEAFLLQKDLDKLVTNRRINAINHGINETVTEGIGGFLGIVKLGKTATGKIAADAATEILIEEQAAEVLNRITDLATQGDRIAPEMQNFLSLAYDTAIAFGPILAVGAVGTINSSINENREDAKDQARRDRFMKNYPKVRKNYDLMTKTLADYGSELPTYAEQIQKIKDSIVNPSIKDSKATDAAPPKAETLAGIPVSDQTSQEINQPESISGVPILNQASTEINNPEPIKQAEKPAEIEIPLVEKPVVNTSERESIDDINKKLLASEAKLKRSGLSLELELAKSNIRLNGETNENKKQLADAEKALKDFDDSQSTEKTEPSKPNPTLKVSREMIDHGHNILGQSKDFSEWSKQMIKKFGEGNTVQALKAIYDYIVASAKKAYNAIGDAVTYVKSNMKGIDISMSQAKDRREFKEAIDPRTSTPEKLAAINKRFPGLYNEALHQILVEAEGGLDHLDIDVTNLAKLYSFKERGFDGGSTMVDEGTFTADLEGKNVEAPLVNPDGSPAVKDNPLTQDDQDVLKTLYDSKIISEDQLDSALNSLFKTRKFLSLFGRRGQMSIKNPNVESLNNSADSTITEREKRQSKIKEAYATDSVMDPANPDHDRNSSMPKAFVHGTSNFAEGTTDPMDVLAHLGITPTLQPYNETEDPNSPLRYNALTLSTRDKKKLYDFYDSQFGKNNWLIKDAAGAASQGLHLAEDLRRDIRKKTDMFEGVAQAMIPIYAEYRVNVYLDKDGKARAIPFAISKKNINSRGTSGSHLKPFTVSVDTHTELQKFAEKALQQVVDKKKDKATGRGAVYGIDVVISKDNKKGNWEFKILEFNSPDPYFDKDNMGGTTGTFSRFNGFPLANLNAFLQGKVPADVSLTHIMAHMIKTGKMKVNGNTLEAIPQDVKEKINKAASQSTENPNSRMNSGIDPTRLAKDLQVIYRGTKDLISFTAAIIQKIGQWIAPYAKALWREMYNHLGVLTESFLVKSGIMLNAVQDIKKLKDTTDAPINLFLNAFSSSVKQKDRKIEDVIKIASGYVSDMLQSIISIHRGDLDSYDGVIEVFADLPDLGMEEIRKIYKNREEGIELPVRIFRATDFIARPSGYTFDMFMRMADGRFYDPDIYEHAVEASDLTKKLASMDEDQRKRLLKEEENKTWIQRTDSLHAVIEHEIEAYRDHQNQNGIDEYPSIWVSPKIIEVALLLKAISKYAYEYKNGEVRISEITKGNRNLVSVMPGDISFITNEIKKDKDLKTAFKDGIEAITKANITSSSNRGWVKHNRSDKEADVIQLTKDAAGTPWCTKFEENARSQLSRGDFYTYHNNEGKAIVAIRTDDGTIEEIRGTEDNQDLKQEEFDIAEKFIRESKLNGGEEFLADADLKKKLMSASHEELYEIGLKNINNNGEIVKYRVRADGKYLSRFGRDGEPIYIPKLNKIRKSFLGAIGYGSNGEYPYVVQQRVNEAFQDQWVEFLEEGKIWDGIGEVPKDGIVEILNYNNEVFAPTTTNGPSGPIRINKETGINKINFALGYLVVTDHDLDIGILNGDIAAVGKSKITIKELNGIFSAEGSSSVSIDKASKESEIKMMESSYGKMGKTEGVVELLGNSSVIIDEAINARIMSKDQSTVTIKDLKRTERGHLSVYSTSKAFVDNASNPNIMLRGNSSLYAKKINGGEINTEVSSMASIDELTGSILNANGWSNVTIERVGGKHSINVIDQASVHIGSVKGTKDDLEMSGSGWWFRPVIKAVGFRSLITIDELDFKEARITKDYTEDDRHSGMSEEEKARIAITIDKYIAGEVDLEFGGIQILNRVNPVDEGTYIMSIIGVDPTRIVNDIKTIYKETKDFMSWSGKMIKKFGEKIRPLLNAIFSQLKQFAGEITEDFLHKIGVLQYAQNPKAKTPVKSAKQNATKDYNPDNYIRLDGNIKVDKSYLDPAHLAKAEKLAAIIAKKNKGVNAGIMSHTDIMTNIAEIKANEEDNKFIQLKKENPLVFHDYKNDRSYKNDPEKTLSYKEAKQMLLDYLDQKDASDPIDDKKARPDSEARRSAIKSLKRNLGIAEKYKQSDEFKNLPENIKRFLLMGIAGINESITDESSTNNIKRAAIALASLTDDGSPVGMFKFAYEKFHVENIDKIKAIEATAGKPLHVLLSDPLGVLRRMEFFGDKTGTGASVASVPLEAAKMSGGFDQVEQWLQNLYSIFVANLDHQSAEYSYERELFNEYVNSLFPRGVILNSLAGTQSSISVEEQVRVGIASILTQYEVNSLNPLEELERASENVFNGINFRKNVPHEGWNAALDEKAFNALMQGIDYRSMTADQVVQAIEANLTSPERSVLYYARSKSAQYLPSLRVVAGISGNRLLSEYTNYVKTSQRKGPTEERPMGGALAFDNMQSVVMERKGLSHDGTTPNSRVNGYYETSILQLMNTFLDEASYEKHTGVERTMIRQLLNDNRFTDNLEEPNQRVNKPRTERLKSTFGNYHSSRIGNTNHFGRVTGLYLTASSLLKGSILISVAAFMGNTGSAIVNSLALASFPARGIRMLATIMPEYASSGQIRRDSDKWLADNFPSQLRRSRTEEISLALRPGPNKGLERAQKELAAGRNQLITILENGFQIGFGVVVDKLAGGIINRLSHLSAASAETLSSKLGVWASYISQLNEKGHSYDSLEEFLLNPVVDNEAMTSAMFTIDKMTGIASMKESQGGFYHLDTKVKVMMNDTLMLFGRQLSQMNIQAGTELSQVFARGLTSTQRAKHLARFANILASVLAYSFAKHQLKALLYGGTALAVPFIAQFISNEDDERKKKIIRDELLRIELNERRKSQFNYVVDIANTVLGNSFPGLNTTLGRDKISAKLFDNFVSKDEDKLLDNSIELAQTELDSMKVGLESSKRRFGLFDEKTSKLASTIMAQEDKIETMKNLKGIRVEAYGERFANQFTGVLGSKVIDIGKSVIDWVSAGDKTEEQIRLEDAEESMTTIGGKFMSAVDSVAFQSGFKQAYNRTIKQLAQDLITEQNKDAKVTERMDRTMKNKAGKNE